MERFPGSEMLRAMELHGLTDHRLHHWPGVAVVEWQARQSSESGEALAARVRFPRSPDAMSLPFQHLLLAARKAGPLKLLSDLQEPQRQRASAELLKVFLREEEERFRPVLYICVRLGTPTRAVIRRPVLAFGRYFLIRSRISASRLAPVLPPMTTATI